MEKYKKDFIKSLEGISYFEWIKLKTAIDRYFEFRASDMRKEIKFTDPDQIEELIRSQFG